MKRGDPSATALLVAASVLRCGAAHGLPDMAMQVAERALARAPGCWPRVAALTRYRIGRSVLAAIEGVMLPGLAQHHCRRKAWLWQELQHAAVDGGRFIWLGVGFDGLGRALLANHAGVRVIETDHPDSLRLRRAAVDASAAVVRELELPGDLAALSAICAEQPTTLVAEGLLMYLPPRVVLRVLRALRALPTPPQLLFTALDVAPALGRGFNRPSAVVGRWLERRGEPFRWRARPDRIRRLLAASGYVVRAQWDAAGFGEYAMAAQWRLDASAARRIEAASLSAATWPCHPVRPCQDQHGSPSLNTDPSQP